VTDNTQHTPAYSAGFHRAALTEAMLRAGRTLGSASSMFSHACAERLGLHPTDWECVTLLDEASPEGLSAGQLAELTGLTTGAITGVIDRLEAAGFVRRARDPGDRRRVVVELDGPKFGQALSVVAEMVADMIAVQADYSDAELATVIEVLGKASAILRTHALTLRAETRAAG